MTSEQSGGMGMKQNAQAKIFSERGHGIFFRGGGDLYFGGQSD